MMNFGRKNFFLILVIALFFKAGWSRAAINLNDQYSALSAQLAQHPDDVGLKMNLAYLYSQGFEFKRARDLYFEVMAVEPKNIRAVNELCVIETQIGEVSAAENYCKKAVELDPSNPLTHDNLGLSYFKLNEPQKSFKPFLEALALQPDSVMIQYHLVQAYMAIGENLFAQNFLRNLLAKPGIKNEDRALLLHGLYQADLRLKNYQESYQSILETYRLSQNGLFLGKVVAAYMRAHQVLFFCVFSAIIMLASAYFGKRLNRFLKNE